MKYEVLYVQEAENKATGKKFSTWWRCGYAHKSDNGIITVRLAVMPNKVDEEGNYKLVLKEQEQREPRPQGNQGGGEGGSWL